LKGEVEKEEKKKKGEERKSDNRLILLYLEYSLFWGKKEGEKKACRKRRGGRLGRRRGRGEKV